MNADSFYCLFLKNLLSFLRSEESSIYEIYYPLAIKLLNRLRLGFSHLHEHKFRHDLQTLSATYVHLLWKLKMRSIVFYATTVTSPFLQPL